MRKIKNPPPPPPPADNFDLWAKRIVKEIRAARSAEKVGEALLLRESEWGATAYCVYEYVWKLDREEMFDDLKKHLGTSRGPRPSKSGLVMRLVNRASGGRNLISASRRSRLADVLEIARTFEVEPKLILGFLSEIGGQGVIEEVRTDPAALVGLVAYRAKGLGA